MFGAHDVKPGPIAGRPAGNVNQLLAGFLPGD
jgi:hypothetical protein